MPDSARRFPVLLVAQLRRTPWWLASLVAHASLMHLLFLLPFATFAGAPDVTVTVRTSEPLAEPLREPARTAGPARRVFERGLPPRRARPALLWDP